MTQGMLRALTIVATPAIAYFCYHAYATGAAWVIPIYLFAYIALLFVSFWPGIPYGVRAGTMLFLVYGLAVVDLIESGRGGDGRIFLLVAPLLATILFGRRVGTAALVLDVFIMAVFGWAYAGGFLDLPVEKQINYANASAWVSNALILMLMGVLLVFALGFAMAHFDSSLTRSDRLVQGLRARDETLRVRAEKLEVANTLLTERTEVLRVAAGVAQEAASVLNLEEILARIATLVSERFGFYHAGIFLVDRSGEWAELKAVSSREGQRMLARQHRLRIGQEGVVGYVTSRGEPYLAPNVETDEMFFDNPDLPDTCSEMAVPLLSQGKVIGALDVQDTEPDAFRDGDLAVMQTLADLVVVAINNAQLFQQAQESLVAERRAYGEISAQAWMERVRSRRNVGYCYEGGNVVSLAESVETGHRPVSTRRSVSARREGESLPELTLPVRTHGHVIGTLVAHKPDGTDEWTAAEITLIETLAEQLDVALEGARLYEDAQDRAARDRLIGELATRMRQTLDVETVLKTAVSEVRHALNLPEVIVRLRKSE
jgi:GAF domain-containing protein